MSVYTEKELNRNRLGIVRLGEQEIRHLFDLPEGYHVVSVTSDWETRSIKIMVQSDDLPPVDEMAMPPVLTGTIGREWLVEPGDANPARLFYRMNWGLDR